MQLVDPYHSFFLSYWRRVVVVVVFVGWGLYEFSSNSPLWGMLFGGAGLYCAYVFVTNPISKAPQQNSDEEDDSTGDSDKVK